MANGFFLGGVAEGMGQAKERILKERTLEQNQSQFDQTLNLNKNIEEQKAIREKISGIQAESEQFAEQAKEMIANARTPEAKAAAVKLGTTTLLRYKKLIANLQGENPTEEALAPELEKIGTFLNSIPSAAEANQYGIQDEIAKKRALIDAGVAAGPTPPEKYEPVTDANGNVVAQRNVNTGQVIADPRYTKPASNEFITLYDEMQAAKKAGDNEKADRISSRLDKLASDEDGMFVSTPDGTVIGVGVSSKETGNVISAAGFKKQEEEKAKLSEQRFNTRIEERKKAQSELSNLKVLKEIDPETGKFQDIKAEFSALSEFLGITDGKTAKDFQTGISIVTRQQFGQLKGEGQVSNFERELVAKTVPQLTDQEDAFSFTVNRMQNAYEREVLQTNLQEKLISESGLPTRQAEIEAEKIMQNIPSIIPDPNGEDMPMFFSEFKEIKYATNPDLSFEEVLAEWVKTAKAYGWKPDTFSTEGIAEAVK